MIQLGSRNTETARTGTEHLIEQRERIRFFLFFRVIRDIHYSILLKDIRVPYSQNVLTVVIINIGNLILFYIEATVQPKIFSTYVDKMNVICGCPIVCILAERRVYKDVTSFGGYVVTDTINKAFKLAVHGNKSLLNGISVLKNECRVFNVYPVQISPITRQLIASLCPDSCQVSNTGFQLAFGAGISNTIVHIDKWRTAIGRCQIYQSLPVRIFIVTPTKGKISGFRLPCPFYQRNSYIKIVTVYTDTTSEKILDTGRSRPCLYSDTVTLTQVHKHKTIHIVHITAITVRHHFYSGYFVDVRNNLATS